MQNVVIKKIDMERNLAAGVYLSEAQNPTPLHTVYVYTVCILLHSGKGEGGGGR
jgi:hypothetical protein